MRFMLIIASYYLYIIEAVVTLGLIAVGVDMIIGYFQQIREEAHKGRHRINKHRTVVQAEHRFRQEKAAHEGFFEESYVQEVDDFGNVYYRHERALTETALAYHREMDRLHDDHIFQLGTDL